MMMSVTRCYTCITPFCQTSYRLTIAVFTVLQSMCLIVCIIPMVPVEFLQDRMRTMLFFDGNPLVAKANRSMLSTFLHKYNGGDHDGLQISELLAGLSNISSDKSLFTESHSLGYYSESPLCINILTGMSGFDAVKILRIVTIIVIIGVISLSYIIIAFTNKQNMPQHVPDVRQDRARQEKARLLNFKVTAIIVSQVCCWIPILIASILSLHDIQINSGFYEIAAIIILPINSITNPILYTDFIQVVRKCCRQDDQVNENIEMHVIHNIVLGPHPTCETPDTIQEPSRAAGVEQRSPR